MLLTRTQIKGNLRRTAEKGLISLLNQYQLEQLALKYFGVYENEQLIGYQCPYSGELITNFNDIVLEHIVPVASKGGTVLFNCIPTSKEVNAANQKGAKHLIDWWTNPDNGYWDKEAPLRLEKIVNYMLEAYELVFKEYTIEEVENSYLEIEPDETILEEEDNLALDEKTESNLSKQAKNNGIHSYLGFILDCINTLEKNNINTTNIREKLANLEEQNIFKDIEKYQLYQNMIKQLIISRIGDNNSSYLSYTLNFDMKKLMDSINLDNQKEIYNELDLRLKNIEQLLSSNNLSIVEYFKSLRDITDIDIIYKNINEVSQEDINTFLINIKIGIDTKIDIFIDMLSDNKYTSYENGRPNSLNIFKQKNKIPFKGYDNIEGINTASFWRNNSDKIKERLNILEINPNNIEEDKEKYQRVRLAINEYEFQNQDSGLIKRIDCFIEMLSESKYTGYENGNPNKENIFSSSNKIPFKGYENINGLNTVGFWINNSNKIKERLEKLENNPNNSKEDKEKYRRVRRSIEEYEFNTKIEKRIDCFIEMLSKSKYTSYENGQPNKENIFSNSNSIPFEDYESINGLNTARFWGHNSNEIKERLEELETNPNNTEKDKEKYQRVRMSIKEYEFYTSLDKRIDCFIEMLSDKQYTSYKNGKPNKENILSVQNQIAFKNYDNIEGINTARFWRDNSDKIKERLNILEINPNNTEKDKEKYQRVRLAINEYEFQSQDSGLMKRIDCFIEMLSDKQYTSYKNGKPNHQNIFKASNQIHFKGYESIEGLNTANFWSSNSNKIKERLEELETNPNNTKKDKEKYQRVRRSIEEYEFYTSLDKRIDCFIEMLSDKQYTSYENGKPNKKNILSQLNKIPFKGYENIEGLSTAQFWRGNLDEIKERLEELEINPNNAEKDKEKYQRVRIALKKYEFYTNLDKRVDCFIEMLSDKQYTSYENSKPNKENIFSSSNRTPFKEFENIEGLSTARFWGENSRKIKERLEKLETNPNNTEKDKEKYQRVRMAIEQWEFYTNIDKRIDCFIEMLSDKHYTSYEKNRPNKNNIFGNQNKIPFKGYENIEGLSTAQFWTGHSTKRIIPLLFFNKQYDDNNKVYIDSKKDYSGKEYDTARSAVLEYLKVSNINEYINNLEQKQKKTTDVINLINLRNSTREVLEYLTKEEEKIIEENNQLLNEYYNKQRGTEIRRAV